MSGNILQKLNLEQGFLHDYWLFKNTWIYLAT